MPRLNPENTNAVAHRIAGDSLVYDCPDCEFGEIPVAVLVDRGSAACIDCETEFELHVERVAN